MASITKRVGKDGQVTYKLVCCVGRDDFGKQVWRTKTIKSPCLTPAKERKEVERIADAWEIEQKEEYKRTGRTTAKSGVTLKEFVEEHWLADHVKGGGLKPSSISFYTHISSNIIDYFGSKIKLNEIAPQDVVRYVKYLRTEATSKNGKPFTPSTIQHHFSTLRTILEYARSVRYIKENPCRDLLARDKPSRSKKKIDYLEKTEAERFFKCLQEESAVSGRIYWECLVSMLLKLGLRRGECVGLQWGDIVSVEGVPFLRVMRNITVDKSAREKYHVGTPKNGEERVLPLPPKLHADLMQHKREQEQIFGKLENDAYIFSAAANPYKPLYPTEPTRWLSKFVKRNNLPNVSPHDLRHTAATLALDATGNIKGVQAMLGHRDPATTMAFYAAITKDTLLATIGGVEAALERVEPQESGGEAIAQPEVEKN